MVKTFHTKCIAIQRQCNDAMIDSVNKQGKNCYPQVYVEKCKYINAEN